MKTIKILKWIGAAMFLFSMLACASFGKAKDFTPYAPMGLVTVTSNYDINWIGEKTIESGANISNFVRRSLRIATDKNKVRVSKTGDIINEADSLLRKILTEAEVFHLEDKGRLINSATYAWGGENRGIIPENTVVADGYKFINYRDKEFSAELALETGVKSMLYINFEFTKEFVSGFAKTGKCRARVMMTAILVDPSGKIIRRREFDTFSRDLIAVSDGAYIEEELMELFKEPIGEACYRFIWDYTGVPET
jgi:hypothetical protein